MIEDKDVHIQVGSYWHGHSIDVLNAEGDRVLFCLGWIKGLDELGAGGEENFVDLLRFLGYTVDHVRD